MKELAIAYRVYPGVSKNPIVFPHDKLRLSLLCFDSFCRGLGTLDVALTVLFDGCPDVYPEQFRAIWESYGRQSVHLITLSREGNQMTFGRQIQLLLDQRESEYIMFAEDDYFYTPGGIQKCHGLLSHCKNADFVTPYDHLDYYTRDIHRRSRRVLFCGHHFQSVDTTCLTFLTRKWVLAANKQVFQSYCHGNYDYAVWITLTKGLLTRPSAYIKALVRRDRFFMHVVKNVLVHGWRDFLLKRRVFLYSPIPSVATHLEEDFVAPGVSWRSLIADAIGRLSLGR